MPRRSRREPARNPRGLGANMPQQSRDESVEESVVRSPRLRASSERRESRRSEAPSHRRSQSAPRGVLMDIHRLQQTVGLLIPKLPFARVIREVLLTFSGTNLRITATCLLALQEAAEIFLVQLFEDAYLCTHHRQRVTLTVKDMQLTLALRKPC